MCLYRPPTRSVATFCDELSDLLLENIDKLESLIVMGDFNMCITNPRGVLFRDIMESFGFSSYVHFPTHDSGHILDNVFCPDGILCTCDLGSKFSDHYSIHMQLTLPCKLPPPSICHSTRRSYKKLDIPNLCKSVEEKVHNIKPMLDEESDLVSIIERTLTASLDEQIPERTVKIKTSWENPWLTGSLRDELRQKRLLERQWLKNKNNKDLKRRLNQLNRSFSAKSYAIKCAYYRNKLVESKDLKQKYQLIETLLFRKPSLPLPNGENLPELANEFASFFDDKIQRIRRDLRDRSTQLTKAISWDHCEQHSTNLLTTFTPLSLSDLHSLLGKISNKQNEQDVINTAILKDIYASIAPLLLELVNNSLNSGIFPDSLKTAYVTPLLKKPSLPHECKNYRPVSGLKLLGKLIEKAVEDQIKSHLEENRLLNANQAAYRAHRSTETALLQMQDYILSCTDKGEVVLLLLLDLSAAFDTIEHLKLLDRLHTLGIRDTALAWIASYLKDRNQVVKLMSKKGELVLSHKVHLSCGVPGLTTRPNFIHFLHNAFTICDKKS